MSRRLFMLLVAAAALLLVGASPALLSPTPLHVRVEGKTRSIFGPTEPLLSSGGTPLAALETASVAGEFYYHVATASFGKYVDQIGRYPATGLSGWVFKVNGVSPPVGADAVVLKAGDRVLWYWATFGPNGGPPTLVLRHAGRNCYRVLAQDDAGKTSPARGAVLRVGRRAVKARSGSACLGAHQGLVRATLKGAVRSNALA